MPRDRRASPAARAGRALLVVLAAAYVLALVGLPLANVYAQAFARGISAFVEGLSSPEALHAARLTLLVVGIAVVANTAFGLAAAWIIARHRSLAARLVRTAVDLPLSVSPTVVGLLVVLAWSPNVGLLGGLVRGSGARILFAWPGLVLATILVTLPYVAREVLPALYQLERAEEEAATVLGASRWQTFRNVVLPAIRPSVVYGVVLCAARAAGEFGAVSVVSGKLIGETNTLTLHVERAYAEYETVAAFAAASLLTTVGVLTVVLDALWRRKHER
ncbi:MAG TPA: sulfate ABC transporter permease subunit [Anaeromyxobacter sp.]